MKCLPTLILILSITATAAAQLTPDEVAVLAMANSGQSRRLAEYYAKARAVPESQILLLDGKPGETMSQAVWQNEVRPAIRAWLKAKGLETKIRCFVTVWDVPLRIGKRSGDAPEVVAREEFLAQSRAGLVENLAGLVQTLNGLVPGEKSPDEELPDAELPGKQSPDEALPGEDAVEPETPAKDTKLAALTAEYGAAFTAARRRAQNVESEEEKKRLGRVLERVFVTGGGITGLLRLVAQRGGGEILNSERASQLQGLKGQLQGLGQGLRCWKACPIRPPAICKCSA